MKISAYSPVYGLAFPAGDGKKTTKPTGPEVEERQPGVAVESSPSGPSLSPPHKPFSPDTFLNSLNSRIAYYQSYIRYGNTPADIHASLKLLKQSLRTNTLFSNKLNRIFQRISAQLIQLVDKLPSQAGQGRVQPDERHCQQEAVNRLICATGTIHDMLVRTEDSKSQEDSRTIKTALLKELQQGALRRMMKESPAAVEGERQQQAFESQCQQYLSAPSQAVGDMLQRFLAEGEMTLRQVTRKALEQQHGDIRCQLTKVRQFVEQTVNGALSGYPVETDVIFLLRQLTKQLSALMQSLESRIRMTAAMEEPHLHQDWLSPSGIILSVPVRKACGGVLKSLRKTEKKLKHFHNKINHESVAPFQVSRLRAFSSLNDTERNSALTLKEQIWPVFILASMFEKTAKRLESAIVNACREGIDALPVVSCVEQALTAELLALDKDTPLAQLMQAVQCAEEQALEIINQPVTQTAASDGNSVTGLVQEYAGILDKAALKLLTAVNQTRTHFQSPDLVSDVKTVKKMARDVHSALMHALESRSGVALQEHYRWLKSVEIDLRAHWQGITSLAAKGRRRYHLTANAPCSRAASHQAVAIQLAGMNLLHETAKIDLQSQRLHAALHQMIKEGEEQRSVVNCLARQISRIAPDAMVASASDIKSRIATISPAVHLLEYAPHTQPVALTDLMDSQLSALMQVGQQLQQTAWLVLWAPTGKTAHLSLMRIKSELAQLKADIKDAIEAASGVRVHNNSPQGMVAKDAAEWLNRQYVGQNGEKWRQIALHLLSKAFKTDDDPDGELFRLRTELSMRDAAAGEITWPVSAKEWLTTSQTPQEYLLAWAEKRLTYGMLYNVMMYYTPAAMFSPQILKNSLVSPLRLINFLLTPVRMVVTQRAMGKVRPGETHNPDLLAQYQFREYTRALFRLLSMLAPQLVKTLAATLITGYGLINQREYREKFLTRVESRLPGDLFWVGTFSALREAADFFSPSGWTVNQPSPPAIGGEENTTQSVQTLGRTRRAISATHQNGLTNDEENMYHYQPWFTTDDNAREMPNLSTLTQNVSNQFPDLRKLASTKIKQAIKEKFGLHIDPDNTWMHTFSGGASNSDSITGWLHNGMPTRSQTLTQVVIENFNAHHWDDPNVINMYAAVYDVPADSSITDQFLNKLPLPLKPSDLARLVWDIDLYPQYIAVMKQFWAEHGENYKIALHAALIHQLGIEQDNLGHEGTDMVLSAMGIPMTTNTTVSCHVFDVNGYLSSDIMMIQSKKNDFVVLYLPRSGQKFQFFSNSEMMRNWVIKQCANENGRKLIASHFAIRERMDGPTVFGKWGVDRWLKNCKNYKHKINVTNTLATDDIITTLASRQRDRVIEDADNLIKSDSEVNRDMWIEGIDELGTFVPNPVTPFISLGLDIEKAKNSDNENEQKLAVSGIGNDAFQIAIIALSSAFGKFASLNFDFNEATKMGLPYGRAGYSEYRTNMSSYLDYKNMVTEGAQAAIDNPLTTEEAIIVERLSIPLSRDTYLKQCAKPHPSYPTVYEVHSNAANTRPRRCIEIAGKYLPLRQFINGNWEVYNPLNSSKEGRRVILDSNNRFIFYRDKKGATLSKDERVKINGEWGRNQDYFKWPQKTENGKIGYPLSPVKPPSLPASHLTLSERYEFWRHELCPDAVTTNPENDNNIVNLVTTNDQGKQVNYRFPARPLQSVKSEVDYNKKMSKKTIDISVKYNLDSDYGKGKYRVTGFIKAMKADGGMAKKLAGHIQSSFIDAHQRTTFLSEQFFNPDSRAAIADILIKSLNISDPQMLESTLSTFEENLHRLSLKLKDTIDHDFYNVFLVSPEDDVHPPSRPIATEALTPMYDPDGRIYFNTHGTLYTTRMDVVGVMPVDNAFLANIDEPARHRFLLLHELSHSALKTADYFYVRNLRGDWLPPTIDELNAKFEIGLFKGKLAEDFYLDALGKDLDKSWHSDPRTLTPREKSIAEQMVRADPMLRMKLLLNNADTQAILIDHLYENLHLAVTSETPLPASTQLTPENSATGCCTVSR